jgi:hypothetical protein
MTMDFEALLVRAVAPAHLADTVVGDLYERRARLSQTLGEARAQTAYRAEALRSLPSLATYRVVQSLAGNWILALAVAAVICALCFAAIPFWDRLGMGGAGYHVLRMVFIGLILGCIPRASVLSFTFLLLLIGASDAVVDAREFDVGWHILTQSSLYLGLLLDAVAMAAALAALQIVKSIRRNLKSA